MADPHHFNAIPDPGVHFDADPDPAPDENLRPLVYRTFNLSLQASIVSVSTQLCFEPLKLLKFDIYANPDPVFHSDTDPDPGS